MKKLLNYYLFLILISLHFNPSFVQGMGTYGEGEGSSSAGVSTSSAPISTSISSTAPSSSSTSTDRLSPTCRSPVEERCLDARVYTSIFGAQADAWHRGKSELLMHICETIGSNRKQRNLALAGVRLIYKQGGEESEFKSTPIIDLDPIFTSGSDARIVKLQNPGGRQRGSNRVDVNDRRFVIESVTEQFPEEEEKNIKVNLSDKLTELLPEKTNTPTKLSPLILEIWGEKAHFESRQFAEDFFHSEQAIRLYLIKNAQDTCTRLLADIPESSTVYQIIIHMVSVNEMCPNCAIALFLSSEGGELKRVFHNKLKNHCTIFEDTLSILVQVSGLKIFKRPKNDHLRKQLAHQTSASAPNFPPHVAQHLLEEKLSYWNSQQLGLYSPEKGQEYNPNRPQQYVDIYY